MLWIAFLSLGSLGSLAAVAGTAAFAKQRLIEDARSATKGYF